MRAAKTHSAHGYAIAKHKDGRFFNVLDPRGELVCVAVYRKGAEEVIRRLERTEERPDENSTDETGTTHGYEG